MKKAKPKKRPYKYEDKIRVESSFDELLKEFVIPIDKTKSKLKTKKNN